MSSYSFSRKIALRYLWSRRGEAFITIISVIALLGIAIGVAVLIVSMAVMDGFEVALRDKAVGASHVHVYRYAGPIADWVEVRNEICAVPGVAAAAGFTEHQALISVSGQVRGVLLRGIEPGSPTAADLERSVEKSDFLNALFNPPALPVVRPDGEGEAELPGLLVGRELQRRLTLFNGQPVALLSSQVGSSPFGLIPRNRRFLVVGNYTGLASYEELVVYSSVEATQDFFRMAGAVSGIEVTVTDIDQSRVVAGRIQSVLQGRFGGGYLVRDWSERDNVWAALELERQVYFVVLLLIVVMASFSIVTTLIMIVLEKRRDIAVLRTLGASTKSVARIFVMQGAILGAIGTALGLLLGYLGAVLLREYGFELPENVFPTQTVPVLLKPVNFMVIGVAAFIISCISTIYPAWRASRLEPTEALRYE